mmetsp:Transcript_29436/g.32737  ORF Transcript_29436/g.32737 Transcript_29436/m.32737 type:complete len:212 (+) Transcript_29436:120-755(+)|eukprot:CAMPEP_0168518734 /NCGR_PEP_ID=MMETSP0405-20121227/6891_1 /TAXON_ID=498012 /ORGANISM="Trichosphaerium sp, Strain Am-I-7 wt" /LENGTH=211 /DNA_ID=CAMNT_0008539127 /DNA_START=89 /DNA_END=724 /DNA_ORIENTATION=-
MKLLLLTLCFTVAAFAQWPNNKEPWFCHDINCPVFKTVKTTSDYEIRTYANKQTWVGLTIQGNDLETAETEGFMALFKYISGANVEKTKVEMTSPVRNHVVAGAGPLHQSNFTISFYLPFIWQDKKPPTPTDPRVSIMTVEPGTYGITSFYGYATQKEIGQEANKLGVALKNDNIEFDSTSYIFAGYDPPFRVFDRHNEVWFTITSPVVNA